MKDLNKWGIREKAEKLMNKKKGFFEYGKIIEVIKGSDIYVIKGINDTSRARVVRSYAQFAQYLVENYENAGLIIDNLFKEDKDVMLLSQLSILSTYEYKERNVKKLRLIYTNERSRDFMSYLNATVEGVVKAKNLLNDSPSQKTSEILASVISKDFVNLDHVKVRVLRCNELKDWGLVNAVSKGSKREAVAIIVEYTPLKENKFKVFAGKGVIFDAGGYNYKLKEGMIEYMKFDMAGAIAALYGVYAIAKAKIRANVIGAGIFVENLVSEEAYKPGDIIKGLSGKKIEVVNTDAEGRLILADLLWYLQQRYAIDYLVDLATLTKSAFMAVGEEVATIMGNDDALINRIMQTGLDIEERCWPLPLWDEVYKEKLKSYFADIVNVPKDSWAGSIIGGMFIKEFIKSDTRWAHMDITPSAFTTKPTWKGSAGATGFGVRLIAEIVKREA